MLSVFDTQYLKIFENDLKYATNNINFSLGSYEGYSDTFYTSSLEEDGTYELQTWDSFRVLFRWLLILIEWYWEN